MQLKAISLFAVHFAFLASVTACSTTPSLHAEKKSSASVTIAAQPQRFILSDGLQVRLSPPSGFSLTPEHYGFVQPESFSRIKVYEVEVPYQEYLQGLNQESLAQRKIQLVTKEDIELQNAVCHLATLKQAIAGTVFDKKMMICGDELSSVVIEASYPESANATHKQAIFQSITSLSVNIDNQLRLFTGLPFAFNETPSYKITARFRNSLVMRPLSDNSGKSTVVVSHGISENTTTQQLAMHLMAKNGSPDDIDIVRNEPTTLGSIPALATTAYINIAGEAYYTKQILSYQGDRFLLVQTRVPKGKEVVTNSKLNSLLSHFVFKKNTVK